MSEYISTYEYFENFLDLVQEHSIRGIGLNYPEYTKPAINWDDYKAGAWGIFNKYSPSDINDSEMAKAIHYSLKHLEDGHSYLPEFYTNIDDAFNDEAKVSPIYFERVDDVAYIRIPSESLSLNGRIGFTKNLRDIIEELDDTDLKGWAIDLRSSYGGDMWGSLNGLWPFLPQNDPSGYFITPDQKPQPWGPLNDTSVIPNYDLKSKNTPIAVLAGEGTSSAGEALLVSFVGLDNVKIFGAESSGQTTGNKGVTLADDRTIAIAGCVYADRNMKPYGGKIQPDIHVEGQFDHLFQGKQVPADYDVKQDEVFKSAKSWIEDPISLDQKPTSGRSWQPQ